VTDTNYSPDEIRLLDEFANVALRSLVTDDSNDEDCAILAYGQAEAMIVERRKRVGSPTPTGDLGAVVTPLGTTITPQPEQQPSGELTEEAVRRWQCEAERVEITWGGYRVDGIEIDRAVALMREGLAAKESSSNSLALMRTAEACTAMATMRAEKAEKERDEAKKAEGGAS
jgi:hypothetical protein